jgi:hypothetical protein
MARVAILTCSNCTQDSNCASVVCLGDMRQRRGFFASYPQDEPLDLYSLPKVFSAPPHPLPPLGGEGIRGKNFWQTL